MRTALMLGDRFSSVCMWDRWRPLYAKTLAELGLEGKCASIRAADLQPNNQELLGGREDEVFPELLEVAARCVAEDRADVIVLGSTTMHEAHRSEENTSELQSLRSISYSVLRLKQKITKQI